MNKTISPKITALTFGVLTVCFVAAFYVVAAWQEPGSAPPAGNAPTPLNVSATAQTKEGDLTINGVLKTLKDMIVNLVTIKGDGSMSPNLNSDKVDDYHAADLMAQTGGGGVVYYRRCGWSAVAILGVFGLGSCTPPNCAGGDIDLGTQCLGATAGVQTSPECANLTIGICHRWVPAWSGSCERVCLRQ